jgi:hypothetical protein
MVLVKTRRARAGERFSNNQYDDGRYPKTTTGTCTVEDCNVYGLLGDGLCITHWDKNCGKYRDRRKNRDRTNRNTHKQ